MPCKCFACMSGANSHVRTNTSKHGDITLLLADTPRTPASTVPRMQAVVIASVACAVNAAGSASSSDSALPPEYVLHGPNESAMAAMDAEQAEAEAAAAAESGTWVQAGIVVGFVTLMGVGVVFKRWMVERRIAQAIREAQELRDNPRHFTPEQ